MSQSVSCWQNTYIFILSEGWRQKWLLTLVQTVGYKLVPEHLVEDAFRPVGTKPGQIRHQLVCTLRLLEEKWGKLTRWAWRRTGRWTHSDGRPTSLWSWKDTGTTASASQVSNTATTWMDRRLSRVKSFMNGIGPGAVGDEDALSDGQCAVVPDQQEVKEGV